MFYTPTFDGTKLGTVTWGAAATVTHTYDVGATDFVETYVNPELLPSRQVGRRR